MCAPSSTIQEIVLPMQRRVTCHIGPEFYGSGPETNGDPENCDNENLEGEENPIQIMNNILK